MKNLVGDLEKKVKITFSNANIQESIKKARINSDLIILKDLFSKTTNSQIAAETLTQLTTIISKGQFDKVNEFCKSLMMKLQKNDSESVEKDISNQFERKVVEELLILSQPIAPIASKKEEPKVEEKQDIQSIKNVNEDLDSYNNVMKKAMTTDEKEDKEDEKDAPESPEKEEEEKTPMEFPPSFKEEIKKQIVSGDGDVLKGMNDYLLYLDSNNDLTDVMRILAKKHRDKIVSNLHTLCGTEIIMWIRQEMQVMLENFEKAGWNYQSKLRAERKLSEVLAEIVQFFLN